MIVAGATVLTPDGWWETDVAIADGTVARVGAIADRRGEEVLEAAGMFLGPAFVDLHVHLREPGQTWKEDIASGTAAGARGGYAAVMAMPNTDPPVDNADTLRRVTEAARDRGVVEVFVAGALTLGRAGEEMSHLDDLYDAGVRVFSDDGDAVRDAGLLRRIMIYLLDRGDALVAQHAEDRALSVGGHMHQGRVSQVVGVKGIPESAETAMIARDLAIVAEVGGRYHVQHVSTASGVELVRRAKQEGLAVTAEVTPHHLALSEDDVETLDTSMKMYPPLRSAVDRQALVSGLRDGTIDAVATDHAPHSDAEKDVPFEEAPRGVIGLETAFAVTSGALDGDLDLVFERMSIAPAKIAGLERHGQPVSVGAPANLVLVDPTSEWIVESQVSKSSNSPFNGRQMKGRVVATIVDGDLVHGVYT